MKSREKAENPGKAGKTEKTGKTELFAGRACVIIVINRLAPMLLILFKAMNNAGVSLQITMNNYELL